MKTGIILEINDGTAIVLQPDGTFIEQPSQPGWETGDVVTLELPRPKALVFRRWAAVAACLLLFVVAGFAVNSLFFRTNAIISVDINPSFELELNRRGQVIETVSYNQDAAALLSELDLKWAPYEDALAQILQSAAMQGYLHQNGFLDFAVYAASGESGLLDDVTRLATGLTAEYPQVQVSCSGAGHEVVEQAHAHGMTPGKWQALQELQALDPAANVEAYSDQGLGAIRQRIRECHEGGQSQESGHGWQQGDAAQPDSSIQSSSNVQPESTQPESLPPESPPPEDTSQGQGQGGRHGHGHGHG